MIQRLLVRRPKLGKLLRWKYLLPRLGALLAIVLTVRLCLDGALRWAIIASGESALGAKVEIAELETKLGEGRITLRGLAAANPSKPFHNLLEASDANFQIDLAALLRKRIVVTDGRVAGLEFNTPRETSGALEVAVAEAETAGPSLLDPAVAAAREYGAVWANNLSERLEADLEAKLETPRVARELEARWPAEYEELERRIKDLQAQGKEIELGFREVKANPLRNLQRLEKLQADLLSTEKEIKSLTAKIQGLPQQVEADRRQIDLARQKDEAFVKEMLHIDDLDGDQLSSYLLEEESSGYLASAVQWIKRAREITPHKPKPSRSRGVNVLYVDRQRPQWLVEQVQLSGTARLGGQAIELCGALTDASSQPQLHAEPMRLTLVGQGAVVCDLAVEMDRRGDEPLDTLTFDCPQLAIPSRTLGKPEKLAVTVAGGPAHLHGEVILRGDQLEGHIEWDQTEVQLAACIGKLRDEQLKLALDHSLSALDRMQAYMELSGTLNAPEWKLKSDLGPQLADSLKTAMNDYLVVRSQKVMAGVREKVDQQLASLTKKREEAREKLLAKLGENEKMLAQLAPLVGGGAGAGRIALPEIDLGKLPFGKFKR